MFRKKKTRDEASIHTVEQIGPRRYMTPEGYLFCEAVPIARVGTMLYRDGETPIRAAVSDGIASVTRDASTLFKPETIASFNGKAVVNEHPITDVTPLNWKHLAVGVCMNTRRGTGDDADVLLGDLMITDRAAIEDVNNGKREVSPGYDADYEQTGEGTGVQTNIIGNHIALVKKGRCGPRCAIGDHASTDDKEFPMGTRTASADTQTRRRALPAAIRKMFQDAADDIAADPSLLDDEPDMADDGPNHTHIHLHTGSDTEAAPMAAEAGAAGGASVEERLSALEATMGQILELLQGGGAEEEPAAEGGELPGAEEGADDNPSGEVGGAEGGATNTDNEGEEGMEGKKTEDRKTTQDSAALESGFRALLSDAEILMPGFRMPTFDGSKTRASTIDMMCATRRQVIDRVYATHDGKELIDSVNGGEPFDVRTATCAATAVVFRAAAGVKRVQNNAAATRDASGIRPPSMVNPSAVGKIRSIAELNAFNAEHWKGRK